MNSPVKCQNEYTDIHPILSGVPQGSVLGPVLYLIHTHDLPTTRMFADDTEVLESHSDPTKTLEI